MSELFGVIKLSENGSYFSMKGFCDFFFNVDQNILPRCQRKPQQNTGNKV
jgi:hypothetical protein